MSSNFTSFISCEPVDIPVIDLSFYIYIYTFFFFFKAEALLHFLEAQKYSLLFPVDRDQANVSSLCRGSGSC